MRIVAIRLQALGDVVLTLSYLHALQRSLPGTEIDFLTRREDRSIPRALRLFGPSNSSAAVDGR